MVEFEMVLNFGDVLPILEGLGVKGGERESKGNRRPEMKEFVYEHKYNFIDLTKPK